MRSEKDRRRAPKRGPAYIRTKTNNLCKTEIIIKFRKITINYNKKFLKISKPTPNKKTKLQALTGINASLL